MALSDQIVVFTKGFQYLRSGSDGYILPSLMRDGVCRKTGEPLEGI